MTLPRTTALLLSFALSLCAVACAAPTADAPDGELAASSAEPLVSAPVAGARVVPSASGARRLELVDARGAKLATYYPGFFTARLLVPDVAGNTGRLVIDRVQGSDVLSAAFNPRTGVVAVAVRGFLYAETSTDMVFLFATRGAVFVADPYASPTFLPFEGRAADGTLASSWDGVRPFLDVTSVAYDAAGRLLVGVADASGGVGAIRYAPDLRVIDCAITGGEGARCPTR